MIGRLSGIVLESRPDRIVLDVSGVGYELTVPLGTFVALPPAGERATLRVATIVREDSIQLFGFATAEERTVFEKLLSVTGIGPKLAVTILSGIPLPELVGAITAQNVKRLCAIPGVGKKLAERLGLELRDKLAGVAPSPVPSGPAERLSALADDAVGALLNLGYRRPQAEAAVEAASKEPAAVDLSALLSAALRRLVR